MIGFGYREDYDEKNRIVKQENVIYKDKEYLISTVDLGIDHGYGHITGVYWETMIFPKGDWSDLYCDRYQSLDDAKAGHERAKEMLLSGQINKEE